MKKLLSILFLVSVCAALEVPEDYQLSSNDLRQAALSTHRDSGRICASMPKDMKLSERILAL